VSLSLASSCVQHALHMQHCVSFRISLFL